MADTNTAKSVLKLVATTSSKIRDLTIQSGQLCFLYDIGRIAFDYKGNRVFYNQIVELETEAERQSLENPLDGYYFIIDTACLWFYEHINENEGKWIQITDKPKDIVFIGAEFPELGQANKIYIDIDDKEISVWDEETNSYVTVSNYTQEATKEDIENLFV